MVRNYQKKLGNDDHCNYSPVNLTRAMNEVKRGRLSLRKAAEQFGIPRSTLSDKLNGNHANTVGRPSNLSPEDEQYLTEGLQEAALWGFPFKSIDIQLVIQKFLNSIKKRIATSEDNKPGREWVRNYLQRHPELSVRIAQNCKSQRCEVTCDIVDGYFTQLQTTIHGIPPENLINYDETNFTDDPGAVKVIVKKGTKYPHRVLDVSKASVSVMMAAAANGTLLPPYTVYKATHLYPTWIENGVTGAGYNRNKSGWFDMDIFDDWFDLIVLPYFKNKPGRKAMIGNQLSSHISLQVIKKCRENNIEFVLLPANATHLLQPLDVAFFRPLKGAWRTVLEEWKLRNRGVLPKSLFPSLLKTALDKVGASLPTNFTAGFKACGIFPFNKEKVLMKLPDYKHPLTQEEHGTKWTEAFVEVLKEARGVTGNSEQPKRGRGKRLAVVPGKGIRAEDFEAKRVDQGEDSSDDSIIDDPDEPDSNGNDVDCEASTSAAQPTSEPIVFKEKDFVLVTLPTDNGKKIKNYAGQIVNIESDGFEIMFMRKKASAKQIHFVFPDVPDVDTVDPSHVKLQLNAVLMRRGKYIFSEIENMPVE